MTEPEFDNTTGFVGELLPILDRDGAECRVAILKATLSILNDGSLAPADTPRPIRLGNEMWGAPEVPDIRLPSDYCASKPGTDVIVIADAQHPRGQPATAFEVDITIHDRTKHLRVHGPRVWKSGLLGLAPGASQPVNAVAIRWGLAFGGFDSSDPGRPLEEPLNPIGLGIARDKSLLLGRPAPQVEDRSAPITAPSRRNRPAGCTAIGPTFQPRRKFAGTYDDKWLQSTFPGRPADYCEKHENAAPPDQIFANPLAGGEVVVLDGVGRGSGIRFVVPRVYVAIDAIIGNNTHRVRPHLDTVLVDASARLVELTWRGTFRCPLTARDRFESVTASTKAQL